MEKIIYKKEYDAPMFYSSDRTKNVKSYIEIRMYFHFKTGLYFSVSVPNISYYSRNIFKAILKIIEHESIGMSKYERIKQDIRKLKLDNKLYQ